MYFENIEKLGHISIHIADFNVQKFLVNVVSAENDPSVHVIHLA